jgi:multiple sugar transport system substrate-binding protein
MIERKLTRRGLLRVGLAGTAAVGTAAILAACGEEATPVAEAPAAEAAAPVAEAAPATEAMKETVTVEYINWAFSELGESASAEILDTFHSTMPSINVVPQNLGFTQAQDKMVALHAAGALADAVQIGFWQVGEFFDLGMIREVETMANAANFDWSEYAAPLKSMAAGKISVVPMSTITGLTHFNVDTFDAAGVAGPPDNWDEQIEIAKQVTDADNFKYGISHAWGLENAQLYSHVYPQIWQAGGQVEDDNDGTFIANTDEGLTAMQHVLDLELEHQVVAPGSLNGVEQTLIENFGSGVSGMFYDNSAHLNGYLSTDGLNFDVSAPLEGPARRSGFTFGWRNAIAERSENPQETFDFLAWIASVEGNNLVAGLGNQVPANKNATPDYAVGGMTSLVEQAIKWAGFEGAQGHEGFGGEQRTIFAREIHNAINGEASAAEVLTATEEKWNASVS